MSNPFFSKPMIPVTYTVLVERKMWVPATLETEDDLLKYYEEEMRTNRFWVHSDAKTILQGVEK
jgi:hypothetical protein